MLKRGMNCFYCGASESRVLDKRGAKGGSEIRRRRECLKCHKRYTTYEKFGGVSLLVIKRDGRREQFSSQKIRSGLEKALEKRPGLDKVGEIADKIEGKLINSGQREIQSLDIGRMILSELRRLDKVAYLRFASVYREFGTVNDFAKELQGLT